MKIDGFEVGYKLSISIDFDGVIHKYGLGWHNGSIYDKQIIGAKKAIDKLKKKYKIVISTCRQPIEDVEVWLKKNDIYFDLVTNNKEPARFYIDDNGIRFNSWKDTLELIEKYENL